MKRDLDLRILWKERRVKVTSGLTLCDTRKFRRDLLNPVMVLINPVTKH